MQPGTPPARCGAPGGVGPLALARTIVEILAGTRSGAAALATVIGRSGSAPQVVGAKLLLLADGTVFGTVGGGAIEVQVLEACRQVLREGAARIVRAHLVRDLGMCCGGAMEVFVEYLQPIHRLFLIGAGHVAQALAPLAGTVGFRLVVIDDREDLLNSPAFAAADRLPHDVDELDTLLEPRETDFLVIVTRDHARDERALATLLRKPHRYLGMIGSRRKVHTILTRVLEREAALGRPPPDLTRVHAPIGLHLGGRTPAEIAVSIVAELVAVQHGGSGASMSIVEAAAHKLDVAP